MRVEHDRISTIHAAHGPAPALGKAEETAVGGIHVKPQSLTPGQVGHRAEVIHCAGVGSPGAGNGKERHKTLAAIVCDFVLQQIQPDSKMPVRRNDTDIALRKPREYGRLDHRVMYLVASVDRPCLQVLTQQGAACRNDGDEICHRPTRREYSACLPRIAYYLGKPTDDGCLQLGQCRCRQPDSDIWVHRIRDKVCNCGVEDSPSGDISEVARSGSVEAFWDELIEQEAQQLGKWGRLVWERLHDRSCEIRDILHIRGRLHGKGLDVGRDTFHGLLDQEPHRLGGEFQFMNLRSVDRIKVGFQCGNPLSVFHTSSK